jgi:parallel beta-helix repeat protein
MKRVIIIFMLILMAAAVSAECESPSLAVSKNTVFCQGNFTMPEGITIEANDIVIDCNNAVIEGAVKGKGFILVNRSGITIKNCIVQGYEQAFYLEGSKDNNIASNEIKDNVVGVYMLNSDNNLFMDNKYSGNDKDWLQTIVNQTTNVPKLTPQPKAPETKQEINVEQKQLPSGLEVAQQLGVAEDYEKAANVVTIERTKTIEGNDLTYNLAVTPNEEVIGLNVYDHYNKPLPKEKVKSERKFSLLNEGMDLLFKLGNVKKDNTENVEYTVEDGATMGLEPVAVASIIKILLPATIIAVNILFGIGVILYLFNMYLKRKK